MSRVGSVSMRKVNEEGQSVTGSRDLGASICLATFDQYRGLLFSIAYRMLGHSGTAERGRIASMCCRARCRI